MSEANRNDKILIWKIYKFLFSFCWLGLYSFSFHFCVGSNLFDKLLGFIWAESVRADLKKNANLYTIKFIRLKRYGGRRTISCKNSIFRQERFN